MITRRYCARGGTSIPSSFSDGQREPEVVEERRQVVHPIRVRDALLIGVALEVLLESRVEVADVRTALAHHLAVEVEHQAQHPVGGGVHRSHVQFHGAVADLHEVDGVQPGLDAEQLAAVPRIAR